MAIPPLRHGYTLRALRGLTHAGVPVAVGTKVIEVDPRGGAAGVWGIGERPRRIARGVLVAVQHWEHRRA